MAITVKSISIYPVKSFHGIDVSSALLTPRGLENDRLYMVVTAADGKFLTQRQEPKMATLFPIISGQSLEIKTLNGGMLVVPVADAFNSRMKVKVQSSHLEALVADTPVNRWLSDYLEKEVRLVRLPGDVHRPTEAQYSRPGDEVSLADEFPLLIATQPSLDALAPHFGTAVTMDRFRPSIVLEGNLPFAEDLWSLIRIGGAEIEVVKPCKRCVITTIDQDTGKKNEAEPLVTLAAQRKGLLGAYFGAHAIQRKGGIIRIGDEMEVLKTRSLPDIIKTAKINGTHFRP